MQTMTYSTLDKNTILNMVVNSSLASSKEIRGCTNDEISILEEKFKIKLPMQYRIFLNAIGKHAGLLYRGEDIFLDDIYTFNFKEAANELLKDEKLEKLPDSAFVFSMHQGYEFLYFIASDGDDPPVYKFVEGEGSPRVVWPSFSAFIEDSINTHVQRLSR